MTYDKSFFVEKYIINGLHDIQSDGYWSLYNDILMKIGMLLICIIFPGALKSE